MDIDVSLVEDTRRLAKQCQMKDLIEELENKCKQVYQFGETVFCVHPCNICTLAQSIWNYREFLILVPGLTLLHPMTDICLVLMFFLANDATVSNKPGVCVKVLTLKPRHCQLEEELAQLADAALPAELGVR